MRPGQEREGEGGGRGQKQGKNKSHNPSGVLEWLSQEGSLSTGVGDDVTMASTMTPSQRQKHRWTVASITLNSFTVWLCHVRLSLFWAIMESAAVDTWCELLSSVQVGEAREGLQVLGANPWLNYCQILPFVPSVASVLCQPG